MTAREHTPLPRLLSHAAALARILLKSVQPARALVSTELHRHKRLTPADRRFVSSAAHHALRTWRFARACATGIEEDVALAVSETDSRAVLAASILLARDGLLAPLAAPEPHSDAALEDAAADLLREAGGDVAACRQRGGMLDARTTEFLSDFSDIWPDGDREQDARRCVALRCSLPDWVVSAWREMQPRADFSAIARIGHALGCAAPLTLRVNRLRGTRQNLLAAFPAAGIPARAHPHLPDAIVVDERTDLLDSAWYREGRFEIQDAGSQLIGLAAGDPVGRRVLDACAGGGGKTMQLADAMRGSGHITACDIERAKLRGLEQRVRRLGIAGVETRLVETTSRHSNANPRYPDAIPRNPEAIARYSETYFLDMREAYDLVLVDAPCSGFGTVRRNPAHKWRLSEKTVRRLAERQAAILSRNADAVALGGTLLYATCSLLPQENFMIVEEFLRTHPRFHPDPLAPHFEAAGIGTALLADGMSALPADGMSTLPADGTHALLLSPDVLDSDGFFMARMRAT